MLKKNSIVYFSRRFITNHGGGEECDQYIIDGINEFFNLSLIYEDKAKPIKQSAKRSLLNKIFEEISEIFFLSKNIKYFINSDSIFITGRALSAAIMSIIFGKKIIYNIHGFTNKYAYKIMLLFGVRFIFWGVSARMNNNLNIELKKNTFIDFIPASKLLLSNNIISKNINQDKIIKLLWVGRMEPIKDPILLIDILEELNTSFKDWTIDIIGHGSIFELINIRIKNLPIDIRDKIKLHGQIENQLLHGYYSESDILLITSQTENFSITALEALKYNLKVVSVPIQNYKYSMLKNYILTAEDRSKNKLAMLIIDSIKIKNINQFDSFELRDKYNYQIKKIINWL